MAEWMRSLQLGKRLGQSIVEFAIVGSVLILLMLGMLVFGQLLGWLHTLNNAVRDAARVGATCFDPDNDRDYDEHLIALIDQRITHLPNARSRSIVITSMDANGNPLPPNSRRRGGFLRVEITYDAPVVPIPGILRSPRRLRAGATFMVECDTPPPPPPTSSGPTCSGATCSGATCSGPTCEGTCRGRTCDVTCSGPTCEGTCRGRTCDVTCSGPTCEDTFRGRTCVGRTCDVTCSGPTCGGTCGSDCDTHDWFCRNTYMGPHCDTSSSLCTKMPGCR